MAGPRTNLAVTKYGETYNKLQRPDKFLDESAALDRANERKRERAAVNRPSLGPVSKNKRAKAYHVDSTVNALPLFDDRYPYRSAAPIAECGMRSTLPIDEEEAQYSDDSLGDALAYLRSVRSEASAIPNLLVASTTHGEDTDNTSPQTSKASTSQRAFYQDGAWISVDESYRVTYDDDYELDYVDPQELYYKQLIKRFKAFRSMLNEHGAHKQVQSDAEASRSSSVKPPSNRHEWLYTIDREYPTPNHVSQIDEKNVRRGLEYCVYAMDRFDTISKQKSCWIWTLLALSGDIGTLDSQKMSHIRDLGSKAGEMSTSLHSSSNKQNEGVKDHLLRVDLADEGQDDGNQADKPVSSDASGDVCNPQTGYLRSGANEELELTPEMLLNRAVSGTQNDMQPQTHGSTNTDTNDTALEQARARLLAQLGDNLVQAGIPATAVSIDETHPHHSEQLDRGSDDSQQEVKIRPIPSRAEAERQRQMMRIRDSAAVGLRGPDPPHTEPSNAMHPVSEDHNSCIVDLNTRATIDMILTVVAECYGQRDLLNWRKPW